MTDDVKNKKDRKKDRKYELKINAMKMIDFAEIDYQNPDLAHLVGAGSTISIFSFLVNHVSFLSILTKVIRAVLSTTKKGLA